MDDEVTFLAKAEEVDKLSATEREIWSSYQKYIACFDETMLTTDGLAMTAALLTLATELKIKRKIGGY